MTDREGLPPRPDRMRGLPVDARGYPIPWFVAGINGMRDFRVADRDKRTVAMVHGLCWVCGGALFRQHTYVVGPMCTVNRVSSEPPSHLDCALYSVKACPFLSLPAAERRKVGLPENAGAPGHMISRNPGVGVVWVTRYPIAPFSDNNGGTLLQLPQPLEVSWWTRGRLATREEAEAAIASGYPTLEALCRNDQDRHELGLARERARMYLPP